MSMRLILTALVPMTHEVLDGSLRSERGLQPVRLPQRTRSRSDRLTNTGRLRTREHKPTTKHTTDTLNECFNRGHAVLPGLSAILTGAGSSQQGLTGIKGEVHYGRGCSFVVHPPEGSRRNKTRQVISCYYF